MTDNASKEAALYSFWVDIQGLTRLSSSWATHDQVLDYISKRHALGETPRVPVLHVFSFKGFARAVRWTEPNAGFETVKATIESYGYKLFDSETLATAAGNEVVELAVKVLSEVYGQDWQWQSLASEFSCQW